MSAPEFTQAEIDTAWEDVLRQQASIIKSKEAEITALKSRCDSLCKRLGIALEANVDEAIAEHTAMKAEIERLREALNYARGFMPSGFVDTNSGLSLEETLNQILNPQAALEGKNDK